MGAGKKILLVAEADTGCIYRLGNCITKLLSLDCAESWKTHVSGCAVQARSWDTPDPFCNHVFLKHLCSCNKTGRDNLVVCQNSTSFNTGLFHEKKIQHLI